MRPGLLGIRGCVADAGFGGGAHVKLVRKCVIPGQGSASSSQVKRGTPASPKPNGKAGSEDFYLRQRAVQCEFRAFLYFLDMTLESSRRPDSSDQGHPLRAEPFPCVGACWFCEIRDCGRSPQHFLCFLPLAARLKSSFFF